MPVSNSAGLVTSSTGGMIEASSLISTAAPPSQASSRTGSSNAPASSVSPSLTPTTIPSGFASSSATSPLSSSSTPALGVAGARNSDNTASQLATPSPSRRHDSHNTASAGGPRSNSSSRTQEPRHHPPSDPAAAATPPSASASLCLNGHKFNPQRPSSPAGPAADLVPALASLSTSDARLFTTSFTTHDDITAVPSPRTQANSLGPTSSRPSPSPATRPSLPFLPPLGSRPHFPNGELTVATSSSPTSEEHSSPAPTPPPKSPRTFSFPSLRPGNPSFPRSSVGPLSSVFMGSSQSKPATPTSSSSGNSRSQPPHSAQKLHKTNPHLQAQHATSPAASSALSPGGPTTRGRSPSPTPTQQSQSQSVSSRSQPTATTPSNPLLVPPQAISASGSSNSASSKLKRAFAGRRKKSEDASSLFGRGFGKSSDGDSASTTSLVQSRGMEESTASLSKATAQKQLATQLLGPSANAAASSAAALKKVSSKAFSGAPVVVPPPSEQRSTVLEEGSLTGLTLSLSPASADVSQSSGGRTNRMSIIQLSPGITSAVDYMRAMVPSEEEGQDAETDAPAGDEKKVDGRKTDEMKVQPEEVRGHSSSLSSTSMAAAATVASSSNPLSLSQSSTTSPSAEKEVEYRQREGREPQEKEKGELKEAWRKSDSTIGHHTIRNAGAAGARGSRPVSMAESFQSAYTIVPSGGGGPGSIGGNKRWSTLTGDMDFQVMMEEDGEDEEDSKAASSRAASGSGAQPLKAEEATRTSPSAKNINRRSMSLNVGISSSAKPQVTPAYVSVNAASHRTTEAETLPISHSISEGHSGAILPSNGSTPNSYPHPGPNVRLLPTQPYHGPQSQGSHIHSQSLSNLHPTASHQDQYRHQQQKMTLPPSRPSGKAPATHPLSTSPNYDPSRPPSSLATRGNHSSTAPVSFRQTAISMSNGFAKKAAEKIGGIGKKWGINTSSSGSGYSSSSSGREQGTQSSSYSSSQSHLEQGGVPLARTHSNQSSLASSMKSGASLTSGIATGIIHHVHLPGRNKSKEPEKKRRTPNAPSGAYSVASSITSTSTSESDLSTAPMLGKLVREPLRGRNGGMVFGRDLKTVVQKTRAVVTLSDEQELSSRQIGDRAKMVRELEHRVLPALVVRCAQHILIWGIQEEGLFRVSGRASHVTKLRSEFDTGADYDLTDCTPGDLDPHAVASVFKAYLRELPDSLLTGGLQRLFEAALTQELATYPHQHSNTKITTRPTPGLPSSPKNNFNVGLRKPPSLSTLAMPSFQGMPAASSRLVQDLKSLISRLPQENRDLARTVVDLIRATAAASKDTKMPLSNLLLVFCPSLNMSPPLLKALCENDGIWDPLPQADEVLDIRRETIYLDISADKNLGASDRDDDDYSDAREGLDPERQSIQSTSDYPCSEYNASAENSMLEEAPVHRKRELPRRPTLPTVYLDSQSHCSSSSLSSVQDDVERLSGRDIALSPPPLTSSSADSLMTPVSSGHPSSSHLPLPDSKQERLVKKMSSRDLSKITEHIFRPRHPSAEAPVQFPPSPPTPQKRRSIPLLSLSTADVSPPSASPGLRAKKPSLRHLFTKRSVASLSSASSSGKNRSSIILSSDGTPDSPYLATHSASDSTVSTPLSAVTAPQSSASLLPPVIDTPIEDSSLSLELGLDVSPHQSTPDVRSSGPGTGQTDSTLYASARSSTFSFPTSSNSPLEAESGHSPQGEAIQRTISSSASSTHLSFLSANSQDDDEDWTRSVLIAAGAARD